MAKTAQISYSVSLGKQLENWMVKYKIGTEEWFAWGSPDEPGVVRFAPTEDDRIPSAVRNHAKTIAPSTQETVPGGGVGVCEVCELV